MFNNARVETIVATSTTLNSWLKLICMRVNSATGNESAVPPKQVTPSHIGLFKIY